MKTTKSKTQVPQVTARQRVFAAVSFNQCRLLVRSDKTDDDRLLHLATGLGNLARQIDRPQDTLERLAAYCAGWMEILTPQQVDVFALIHAERKRQDVLFVGKISNYCCASRSSTGRQKLRRLIEHVGLAACIISEINEPYPGEPPFDPAQLTDELLQVATVCVAWLESITP